MQLRREDASLTAMYIPPASNSEEYKLELAYAISKLFMSYVK